MCINLHTFIAFISINISIVCIFGLIIFVFVFLFANISPNNCICIHICPFLVNPNYICICLKNGIQISSYLPKKFNPNIFVFVLAKNCQPKYIKILFGPESCICHTLLVTHFILTLGIFVGVFSFVKLCLKKIFQLKFSVPLTIALLH